MPTPTPLLLALPGDDDAAPRLREDAPRPLIDLDAVAAALWRAEPAACR